MNQTIYNYHPQTGEATSVAVADPSPLEPGIYLLPAYATPTPPPAAGMREVALFRAADGSVPADHAVGAWQLLPDWRGVALWSTVSGEPVTITRPGETPAEIGATDIERTEPTTVWDGVGWVVDVELAAQHLLDLRARQLAAINTEAARLLSTLSASYPDGEVQGWSQQTREAEALAINPTAAAPLLTAIATARGVPLATLAERVRAKVAAYATASGSIIGRRQALEDAVHALDLGAPDAATQLEAITWPA